MFLKWMNMCFINYFIKQSLIKVFKWNAQVTKRIKLKTKTFWVDFYATDQGYPKPVKLVPIKLAQNYRSLTMVVVWLVKIWLRFDWTLK